MYTSHLTLGKEIGNGHFGVVHEGVDDLHGPVAIKIPRQRPGETDVAWHKRRAELLNEGQNLSRAKHPNVVQVHKLVTSTTSDDIRLVMEFCEGGSLQKCYERGPLPCPRVHQYATDLTHGLGALHDRGMIHRDIKPGNILVDQKGRAKLGDFGLVTDEIILGYADEAGYRDHLAPEVFLQGQTSTKTDIWALGMTLYRLLHGAQWYSAHTRPQLIVQDGGYADTLTWLPHISSKWRRLIRSMLNDSSNSRPTISQIHNSLANLSSEIEWTCAPLPDGYKWTRDKQGRTHTVEWRVIGPKKLIWSAVSRPSNGAGRERTLASSPAAASLKQTAKELREFFDRHT